MLVGPILSRELLTTPRRPRHYVVRGMAASLFFVLLWTGWQAILGFQTEQKLGDLAHFNAILFPLFAYTQLALVIFAASMYGATSVSYEKDRRTFVLLLVTRLFDSEIVLDKFLGAMLQVAAAMLAGLPVVAITMLLGGVGGGQLVETYAVTFGAALASAALGVFIAVWRDKTFQAVAMTILTLVFALLAVEVLAASSREGAQWAASLSPFRAIADVVDPTLRTAGPLAGPALGFLLTSLAISALSLTTAIVGLRRWNPRGEPIQQPDAETSPAAEEGAPRRRPSRAVWDNPVLWREMRTRAYGTRPIVIKLGYLLVSAILLASVFLAPPSVDDPRSAAILARALVPMCVLSLLLVNAQAIAAVTSERDLKAIDILLATDLTPKEFVYGKMLGVFYNAKEMIAAPVLAILVFAFQGWIGPIGALYLLAPLAVAYVFSTVLGIHAALRYESSRVALANSLGTMFLLFVGILICLYLIVISGQFEAQWGSFVLFIVLGSIGLWVSLSANAPSGAIALTAALAPAATFYCLVALLVGDRTGPFLVGTSVYAFAVAALLIPLLSEFDVATGRTTAGEG